MVLGEHVLQAPILDILLRERFEQQIVFDELRNLCRYRVVVRLETALCIGLHWIPISNREAGQVLTGYRDQ
jgi:hypothetical protein